MKFQFDAKTEMTFAEVLTMRDKLFQRFGASDFIGGELQFADVPLNGLLNLNLAGLTLDSLSVECFLPKKESSLTELRQTYQQLIPLIGNRFYFAVDYDFRSKPNSSKRFDHFSASVVMGKTEFTFGTETQAEYKAVMEAVIQKAQVPAQVVEEDGFVCIRRNPGADVRLIPDSAKGRSPQWISWPTTCSLSELVEVAEGLALELADPAKGIKCSWIADTVMGGGTAEELVAILNAAKLELPKGKLSFSYLLKELEGLERVRLLLGAKAKLSAQAAVFHWPEEDRGQLWVDTKANGYQIQLHLDDADRIEELQRYLGIEFDSGRESFL